MSVSPKNLYGVVSDLLDILELVLAWRHDRQLNGRVRVKENCLSFAGSARTFLSQVFECEEALMAIIPFDEEFAGICLFDLNWTHFREDSLQR